MPINAPYLRKLCYLSAMVRTFFLLVLTLIILTSFRVPDAASGRVVKVVDGDTYDIVLDGVQSRIRMDAIDARNGARILVRQQKITLENYVTDKPSASTSKAAIGSDALSRKVSYPMAVNSAPR